jgi:hypothetical protein
LRLSWQRDASCCCGRRVSRVWRGPLRLSWQRDAVVAGESAESGGSLCVCSRAGRGMLAALVAGDSVPGDSAGVRREPLRLLY